MPFCCLESVLKLGIDHFFSQNRHANAKYGDSRMRCSAEMQVDLRAGEGETAV